ncbi:hypothetical protein [Acinetobacter lactucae]|uniref:hypothetical protein n=1 Tax=Acinetobacter lactucae TaxID=1785128 RepID=UPI001580EC23|nr:hypothetical protein [Acinetobacter lactucae]NUG21201.1 hypothetical protein [Acinetobacter lactucae]
MTLNEREISFTQNSSIKEQLIKQVLAEKDQKIEELECLLKEAKAQAVPEGYVLVNSESLLFHAQSIRMFNDGDWENHYEEIEEHVCAIEEIVKPSESGAEG